MWPDLLRGIMSNLSSYGMQPAPPQQPTDPMLQGDLARADTNLNPTMNPNPSIDEMIQIAQRLRGPTPYSDVDARIAAEQQRQATIPPPPKTVADATAVAPMQGAKRYLTDGTAPQQTMLNMLMQHLLAANDAPPFMNMGAGRRSADDWQKIYKYYHPTLTPGQPLPQRMR